MKPLSPEENQIFPFAQGAGAQASTAPCWGIMDGAAGLYSQVRGLAQAVGLPCEIKTCRLRGLWFPFWPGVIPQRPWVFHDAQTWSPATPPRLVITCGRQSVVAAGILKRRGGAETCAVHIQDPRVSRSQFDLIVVPEHDRLRGSNVVVTRGAVHHITPELLQRTRNQGPHAAWGWERLGRPLVCVLLGGPNRQYEFTLPTLSPLIELLRESVRRDGASLAVLPSRRTPQEVVAIFQEVFGREHFVWNGTGENPYCYALSQAEHIVATGDSVSMISEAAATGRPVHVYHLPERREARRFRRFHVAFERYGYTRMFHGRLVAWTYEVPRETERVARIILQHMGEPDVSDRRPQAA